MLFVHEVSAFGLLLGRRSWAFGHILGFIHGLQVIWGRGSCEQHLNGFAAFGEFVHLLVLGRNLGVHEVAYDSNGHEAYGAHDDIFQVHFL